MKKTLPLLFIILFVVGCVTRTPNYDYKHEENDATVVLSTNHNKEGIEMFLYHSKSGNWLAFVSDENTNTRTVSVPSKEPVKVRGIYTISSSSRCGPIDAIFIPQPNKTYIIAMNSVVIKDKVLFLKSSRNACKLTIVDSETQKSVFEK